MGILNITPDSFSDGGQFLSLESALAQARQMFAEGADIIDIGGESTRPGATPITLQEELDRVMPILEKIRQELPVTLSVDTSKAAVIREAIAKGAQIINDVTALRGEGSLEAVAASENVHVCLMHMQGDPQSMQQDPFYTDVVAEVKNFLLARTRVCLQAGITPDRLIIDPGFGFGKTLAHNLLLIKQLQVFTELGYRVLVGVSRKSMLGALLNQPPAHRLYGGLALAALAVGKGATIIRTHDVAPTVEVLKVTHAVFSQLPEAN